MSRVDRYDYADLFDSVLDAAEIWAEKLSYNTRFEQQRELEKTQMKVDNCDVINWVTSVFFDAPHRKLPL